ncbi:MAG: hypothetical protein ACTHU0_33610 [Kofleriaceae bacterium]
MFEIMLEIVVYLGFVAYGIIVGVTWHDAGRFLASLCWPYYAFRGTLPLRQEVCASSDPLQDALDRPEVLELLERASDWNKWQLHKQRPRRLAQQHPLDEDDERLN